ncbi:MAG: hypothetical protein K9G60_03725, partial [Pseudolabrys sp.]|nr:hypothetical protein [Pseudolabrys sp.]
RIKGFCARQRRPACAKFAKRWAARTPESTILTPTTGCYQGEGCDVAADVMQSEVIVFIGTEFENVVALTICRSFFRSSRTACSATSPNAHERHSTGRADNEQ